MIWRAASAVGEFLLGLALLCLLATLSVLCGAVLCVGFIGSTLLVEASEMWGTFRQSIRSGR